MRTLKTATDRPAFADHSVTLCQPSRGRLHQGRRTCPCAVLADFLHRFVERRPFFFQTFILDLPQLGIGDFKPIGDDLIRAPNARAEVLRGDQVTEYVTTLLQGQTLRSHLTPLPRVGIIVTAASLIPGANRKRVILEGTAPSSDSL